METTDIGRIKTNNIAHLINKIEEDGFISYSDNRYRYKKEVRVSNEHLYIHLSPPVHYDYYSMVEIRYCFLCRISFKIGILHESYQEIVFQEIVEMLIKQNYLYNFFLSLNTGRYEATYFQTSYENEEKIFHFKSDLYLITLSNSEFKIIYFRQY